MTLTGDGKHILNQDGRTTAETQALVDFLKQHPLTNTWPESIPGAKGNIDRLMPHQTEALEAALIKDPRPVIVLDALKGWNAIEQHWSTSTLGKVCGETIVRVNDRAPARHLDQDGQWPQRSRQLPLRDYLAYMEELPPTLDSSITSYFTPYYLNGWRAFVEVPALALSSPTPEWSVPIDHTVQLLKAIDSQLFGATNTNSNSGATNNDSNSGTWCESVNANLTKVFMGPPGTITRLHYDAGDAHGYLAQIVGRKLIILLPPSATSALYVLETEKETVQSPIDPLKPDLEAYPLYQTVQPLVGIIGPGEAIIIPKGWWHYAVALDRSITMQRNFYHASSNAGGLVGLVLKTAASLQRRM